VLHHRLASAARYRPSELHLDCEIEGCHPEIDFPTSGNLSFEDDGFGWKLIGGPKRTRQTKVDVVFRGRLTGVRDLGSELRGEGVEPSE
jgi:hypothetical protein